MMAVQETQAAAELAAALKQLSQSQLAGQNAKDMAAVLDCMHPDSPWCEATRAFLAPIFDQFTLDNRLLSHTVVGQDADFSYCRLKLSVSRIAGAEFRDLISDNLVAYRRHGADWKIWQQMVLQVGTPPA